MKKLIFFSFFLLFIRCGFYNPNGIWPTIDYSCDNLSFDEVSTTNIFSKRSSHQALVYQNKIYVIGGFSVPLHLSETSLLLIKQGDKENAFQHFRPYI